MLLKPIEKMINLKSDKSFSKQGWKRRNRQDNMWLRVVFSTLISLLFLLSVSAQESQTTDNKSDSNVKSSARVNPVTLAMEFSIPFGSHSGRNGAAIPIGINYSSKMWTLEKQSFDSSSYPTYHPADGYGPVDGSVFAAITLNANNIYPIFSRRAVSGWTSTLQPTSLINSREQYDQFGNLLTIQGSLDSYSSITEESTCTATGLVLIGTTVCSSGGAILAPAVVYECAGEICTVAGQESVTEGDSCTINSVICPEDHSGGGGGGSGGGVITSPNIPTIRHEVNRFRVQMPNGSTHEFRKHDKEFDCTQNSDACSYEPEELKGTYLSTDGSGTRLERFETQTDGSVKDVLYLPDGSRYIFYPSESIVSVNDIASLLPFEKYIDKNGNITSYDHENEKWIDTLGREIKNPLPKTDPFFNTAMPVGSKTYQVKGKKENGVQEYLEYTMDWKNLSDVFEDSSTELHQMGFDKCTSDLDMPVSGNKNLFTRLNNYEEETVSVIGQTGVYKVITKQRVCNPADTYFNPVVLAEVLLPNGHKYEFKYNEYGEITKIIYPTGSYEKFEYGIVPMRGTNAAEVYTQANRGVTKRTVYNVDSNNQTSEIITEYYADSQSIKITAPDGSYSETFFHISPNSGFGFEDPLAGRVKETRGYDSNGVLRSRTVNKYRFEDGRDGVDSNGDPYTANPSAKRDTRLEKSVTIAFELNESHALATMSKSYFDDTGSTDPEFFSHLNVKKTEGYEYAAIPVGTAASITDWSTIETWFPASKLASVTETDYTYDTNYKNAGFLGLPTATFVLNTDNPDNPDNPDRNASNGVLAKTEIYYDYETPPTSNNAPYGADKTYSISGSMDCTVGTNTSQCWKDPNNTFKARPTTTRLWDDDNDIWIESHTQYDIFGNGVATKDHQNREATVEYDSVNKFAYPIGTTSPAPGDGTDGTSEEFKTETSYDFMTGLVLQTKDLRVLGDSNDDLVTTMEYDAYLRPTAVVAPNGARTETEYNDDPNHPEGLWVKTRSQFDANTWNEGIAYSDSLGRAIKTRTIDSNGDVIVESKYDNMGRVTDVSNPYRLGTNASEILWVHTEYDEAGRVETVYSPVNDPENNPGDSVGTNEYGIINNVNGITGVWSVSTDASGRKSRSVTNSLGQLVRVDEATSFGGSITTDLGSIATPHQATTYKYNIKGEMVEVTQGTQKRNFLYDSLGRLIRVKQPEQEVNTAFNKTDPVTGNSEWTMRMEYDVMGKVVESEDANGTKINYSYDAADRVLSATYSDGTPTVSYKYDLIPNGKGALIETSNGVSTSKTTQIDQWGRPTEYQQITDGQTYTSKYSYNLSGALIEEEYPSGKKVKNDFDANGDVERVWGTNGASNQMYANAFNYTASGGIASMRLGNGQWETAKFNNRLQVEELGLGHSATNAGTWKVNYEFGEYDPNSQTVTGSKNTGNIARQTVSFDGLPNAFVQTYQYDSLYRLTDANEMAGSSENWSEKFTYDRYGNRDKKFRNGLEITNNALSHPSIDPNTNRFTTTGYGYDKVGNLVTDAEGRNFTFDGNNKQRIVYDGNQTVGEYFYDGDGMRVKKKVYSNGTLSKTVIFVYSGGKLVEEYSTEAPPTDKKIKYLTKDHLGTPRIITDGNGAVVSRRDFMPFGEEIANNVGTRSTSSFKYSANEDDVRQKFTGYQQDSETNLDFAEARMYENRHARFTAVDPLLASGNSGNPQTFNRYVYVMNSPLSYTDSTGLCPDGGCPDTWDGEVYYRVDDNGDTWYNNNPQQGGFAWTPLALGTNRVIFDSTTGRSIRVYNYNGNKGWRVVGEGGDPLSMLPSKWRNYSRFGAQSRSWEGISARALMNNTITTGDFEDRDIQRRRDLEDADKVTALMTMGQFANFGMMRSAPRIPKGSGFSFSSLKEPLRIIHRNERGSLIFGKNFPFSNNRVRKAVKSLERGENEVLVNTRGEASEVFLRHFQGGSGAPIRRTGSEIGVSSYNKFLFPLKKRNTYHFDRSDRLHPYPHLQVHNSRGKVFRINFLEW